MRRENLIKHSVFISLLVLSIVSLKCDNFLNVDNKPFVTERNVVFKIILTDNSNFMQTLYGTDRVKNASVKLKSNMLGWEYSVTTDSNGVAEISGILSDSYFISAERKMQPEEMKIISGVEAASVRLVNSKKRIVELSAGKNPAVEIPMDVESSGSSLVISEIYACGPTGAGLYYHDKYVEVFNQSDSVIYLDSLMVAVVFSSSYLGLNYRDDPAYVHSKSIWIFPGSGKEYPLMPGEFALCAEDAIDHRMNAPNSVDLSKANFEFYKDDAPDVDNPAVPNMIKIYQDAGNDWLIGGERGAIVIARLNVKELIPYGDEFLIPYTSILDGVEYMSDPTKIADKILNESIDASAAGGIQFYTGKSMERIMIGTGEKILLKDDNNSTVDFKRNEHPTPGYY